MSYMTYLTHPSHPTKAISVLHCWYYDRGARGVTDVYSDCEYDLMFYPVSKGKSMVIVHGREGGERNSNDTGLDRFKWQ